MTRQDKYIVAVSGGVDSVVLLHMLVNRELEEFAHPMNLIVAHFDHGMRDDSASDCEFVQTLADKYGLQFESRREELGVYASEELARSRRYEFLRSVAKKHGAKIVTAHHQDDLVESIAINFIRGTGWRGLAVLGSTDTVRPLLEFQKSDIVKYAEAHKLDWHEDSTNSDTRYLRNSLRSRAAKLDYDTKRLLLLYRNRQLAIRREVDSEVTKLIGHPPYKRHFIINIPSYIAVEFIRTIIGRDTSMMPTIPQATAAVQAIKTLSAGRQFDVGGGVRLRFTKTDFVVTTTNK